MLAALALPVWCLPAFLLMFGVSLYRHLRQSPPLLQQWRAARTAAAAGRHAVYRVTPMGGTDDDRQA